MTQPAPIGVVEQIPANFGRPAYLSWVEETGATGTLQFDLVQQEQWDEGATVSEHPTEQGSDISDHVRIKLRTCELKVWCTNEPIDSNQYAEATTFPTPVKIDAAQFIPGPGIVIVPEWQNAIELRSIAGSLVGLAGGAIGGQATGQVAAVAALAVEAAVIQPFAVPVPIATDAGLLPGVPTAIIAQTQQWPLQSLGGIDYVSLTIKALQTLKNTAQQITVYGSKTHCFPMVIEALTTVRAAEHGSGAEITIGLKEVRVVTTLTVPAPVASLQTAGAGKPTVNRGQQDPVDAPVPVQSGLVTAVNLIKGVLQGPHP